MKKIMLFFAVSAMVIVGLSACGGNGNSKDSGSGYKESFGFLEATERYSSPRSSISSSPVLENDKCFKKEETDKQKKILDQMMTGNNKRIALITGKTFHSGGWVSLDLEKVSIDNGFKISDPDLLFLYLNPKDFPEVSDPFEQYYIILDKKGNVARLQHVPGSYSWGLEHPETRAAIKAQVLNSGGEWSRAKDNIGLSWDIDGFPKRIWESRQKFWEEGGTTDKDFSSQKFHEGDSRLGY
jgi:hypothetical protein